MLPKVGHELGVSIRDDVNWTAIQSEDVLCEQSGDLLGTVSGMARNVVSQLSQAVDNDEDGVESLAFWQVGDEVHCDVVLGALGRWQRLQEALAISTVRFHATAYVAVPHPAAYVCAHSRPVIVSGHYLVGPSSSRVASSGYFVAQAGELGVELVIVRNI